MSTTTREQLVEKCKRLMLEYGSRCSARMGDAAIRAVAGELRAAIEELAASTQAPEAKALDVVAQLDEEACTLLHGLMRDDGELSPITLHVGDGHSGRGLYASLTEYPDEGSVFLCAADAAASPEAPAPPKYTEEWCMRMAALESQSDSEVDVGAPAPQGVQAEPVHWRAVLDEGQREQQLKTTLHVVGFRDRRAAEGWIAQELDFGGWKYTLEPLYAAPPSPPAVQPETGISQERAELVAAWNDLPDALRCHPRLKRLYRAVHAIPSAVSPDVQELLTIIEMLCNGIEWNIENHHEEMTQADEEALAQGRAALSKYGSKQ